MKHFLFVYVSKYPGLLELVFSLFESMSVPVGSFPILIILSETLESQSFEKLCYELLVYQTT